MITKYIKTNKLKDEFASVKNKIFSIKKSELHETICGNKLKYEKLYLKEVPLAEIDFIDYKNKVVLITSINYCLETAYIGQKSYDVLLDNKTVTIMSYHINRVLNGI